MMGSACGRCGAFGTALAPSGMLDLWSLCFKVIEVFADVAVDVPSPHRRASIAALRQEYLELPQAAWDVVRWQPQHEPDSRTTLSSLAWAGETGPW